MDDLFDMMAEKPATSKRNRLEPDYADAFNAWKATPNPQTSSAFLGAVRPIIDSAVRPLGDSPALRGRAKQIALQAGAAYDPNQASLRTHLMTHLQRLKRISGQQSNPIRIPERVILQQKAVNDAMLNLADELGREPSDSELANATGLSVPRLMQLRGYRPALSEGVVSHDADGNPTMGPGVERETPASIWHDFVYADLSPKDQLIFDYALGRNGRQQLPSGLIAQEMRVTPGYVSQRLAAIQERMNELQELDLFGT